MYPMGQEGTRKHLDGLDLRYDNRSHIGIGEHHVR